MISAIYQSVLFWLGAEASDNVLILCQFVFVFLLVMWVDADSRGRSNVYRPHEFGQLVLLFWLPYLPFYLWRTRRVPGMLMFVGIILLFFLGYTAETAIYLLRSA